MKKIILICLLIFTAVASAQNTELAAAYFAKGEYDKAVLLLEPLYKQQPYNQNYYNQLVTCYQQLQQFDKAEALILLHIAQFKLTTAYVTLGYNYALQNKSELAEENYQKAIESIANNPNVVYSIAREFETKSLIPQAIQAYEYAFELNQNPDFNYPLALLYGQAGNYEKMLESIFTYAENNQNSISSVQNMLSFYMTDDAEKNFSNQVRKSLLQRVQKNQDIFWVHFLSWYFVQQQDFAKAFIQEKAVFKREGTNVYKLFSLAEAAQAEKDYETATEILNFIEESVLDQAVQIQTTVLKNKILLANSTPQNYKEMQKLFEQQIEKFEISNNSVALVLQIARFYGFELDNFNEAKHKIDKLLALSLPTLQQAQVKELLADLYVANKKFNQAIIYYGQVQDDVKNNELAHNAQFKMAMANYYKTDFDWALKQFKVLKQSTSLLIANDALEMFLLLNDATRQDSAKVVLTPFAEADFLKFQKKNEQAKQAYLNLLPEAELTEMADVTLYRLAQVNFDLANTAQAIAHLEQLLSQYQESIYRDDAHFLLGIWYEKLGDTEKAQNNLEQIIVHHQDSIYFLEAQTKYRKLRGDKNV